MDYSHDFDLAANYSAKAMELMAEHSIPAHPHNFEIWYCFAAQQNPGLLKKIEEQLSAEEPFDEGLNRELYETYILDGPATSATVDAGARLSTEVDRILKLINAAADSSSELGREVRAACDHLSTDPKPEDVVTAVEAIIAATRHMESRSAELEGKLTQTKNEIEDLRESLEAARSEARTDGLTGIANRTAFDEVLFTEMRQAMEDGTSLCLLMGDIDHFKNFNDMWGHRVGDQVLRLTAVCMRSNIKGRDTAARYGGEEFAIILPDTGLKDAATLGNQIREDIRARELVRKSTNENLGRITISLGLARFRPGEPLSELIERADACLYAAKKAGRDRLITEEALAKRPRIVAG